MTPEQEGGPRFGRHYLLPAAYALTPTASYPALLWLAYPVLLWLGKYALAALTVAESPSFWESALFRLLLAGVLLYALFLLLLGAANIICSFRMAQRGEIRFCINAMLILKYGLIPFFLFNYLLGLLVCLAFFVGTRGMILFAFPVTVPFLLLAVFSVWAMLLPGSFYGLQVVRLGIRQGKLAFPAAIFHLLLQFTFVADVFDAMYLSVKKWEMGKKSAAAVCMACLLGAAATAPAALHLL